MAVPSDTCKYKTMKVFKIIVKEVRDGRCTPALAKYTVYGNKNVDLLQRCRLQHFVWRRLKQKATQQLHYLVGNGKPLLPISTPLPVKFADCTSLWSANQLCSTFLGVLPRANTANSTKQTRARIIKMCFIFETMLQIYIKTIQVASIAFAVIWLGK